MPHSHFPSVTWALGSLRRIILPPESKRVEAPKLPCITVGIVLDVLALELHQFVQLLYLPEKRCYQVAREFDHGACKEKVGHANVGKLPQINRCM